MKSLRLLATVFLLAAISLACISAAPPSMVVTPTPIITSGVTSAPANSATEVAEPTVIAGDDATPTPLVTEMPAAGGGAAEVDVAMLVNNALTRLEQGRLAYNPPKEMTVGQTERVTVRIAKDAGAVDIGTSMPGSGQATVEPIKVGTFMKARLQGRGFDIQPLSNEEQVVAGDTFTEWQWDVTPREAGPHKLSLLITVRINVPEMGEEQRDFPVKDAEVNVRVTPNMAAQRFMQDNGSWLLLVVVAFSAIGIFFAVRSRRQSISFNPNADLPASLAGLHELLYTNFDDDELQSLCLSIGARPDIIGGENAIARARNLVLYAHQRGKLPKLTAACRKQRPLVAWPTE
jgi:hypothetical protein